MSTYILTWDHAAGIMNLTGPFHTLDAAVTWGRHWQEDNGDDPNWQTLQIPAERINNGLYVIEVQHP